VSKRRWIVAGGVVVALAGVVLLVLRYQAPLPQTRDVAVPPDDASPDQVVRAYVDALDAHDCETAAMLRVGHDVGDFCRNLRSVSLDGTSPGRIPRAEDLVTEVEIDADFEWRVFKVDPSLRGQTIWGFSLERAAPDAPWRIAGIAWPG
jgi:hypothetical protein